MKALINEKTVCELVLNRTVLDVDDADMQDELLNNNIFNFAFIPDTESEERTYITFELCGKAIGNTGLYKNISLYFFIFSHHNLIRDKSSGYLRTDLLDEQIQTLFNDNRDFGFGKMTCLSDDYLRVNNSHYGRQLVFKTKELNSSRCG